MTTVYKVSTKFLKTTFLPVLAISILISVLFIGRAGWSAGSVPIVLTFFFLWIMWGYLTAHIEINEQGVTGQSNGFLIDVRWQDVICMEVQQEKDQVFGICLGTAEQTTLLDVRSLDGQTILRSIQAHVPADCTTPEARQKLQEAQAQFVLQQTWPEGQTFHISIAFWMKALLWGCLAGALLLLLLVLDGLIAGRDNLMDAGVVILILTLPLLLLFYVFSRNLYMDQERLTERNWLGQYTIRWDEIETMDTDRLFAYVILKGRGKQFTCLGPYYWSAIEARKSSRLFFFELERRRIPIHKKFWLGFALPWPHASTRQNK